MLVRSCQRYKFNLLREAAKDKDSTTQGKKAATSCRCLISLKNTHRWDDFIGWKVEGPYLHPHKHTETPHTAQVHVLSPNSSRWFLTAGIWARPKAEKIFSQKPMTKTSPSTMFSRLCCTQPWDAGRGEDATEHSRVQGEFVTADKTRITAM